jgi:hypothetical protein
MSMYYHNNNSIFIHMLWLLDLAHIYSANQVTSPAAGFIQSARIRNATIGAK